MFEDYFLQQQDSFLQDLAPLLRIKSVSRPCEDPQAPCGVEVKQALDYMASLARGYGFSATNLGKVTQISWDESLPSDDRKTVYIACHADVVACSSGWTYPPYDLTVRDGRIYGRGVLDNKGAAMAVLYALRALKEHGIQPHVTLKLLIGGCEETSMADMEEYASQYGLPDEALTPDSVFPIVNTEAGMISARICFDRPQAVGPLQLVQFRGGMASNAVPDRAQAVVECGKFASQVYALLRDRFDCSLCGTQIQIEATGISAHASTPQEGKNAITTLAAGLADVFAQHGSEQPFLTVLNRFFAGDFYAQKLGLSCSGPVLGPMTQNVGICDFANGYFTLDMRIPVSGQTERIQDRLAQLAQTYGFRVEYEKVKEYTHVSPDSSFLRGLAAAYKAETGQPAAFLGSTGLTYSKAFAGRCVAFGPVYSEQGEECGGLHGDDEYVRTDVLMRLAAVYAGVIRRLWCK